MNILGISAGFHDAGITLINEGEIMFAGHAERYSKVKHDHELNAEILNDCFDRYGMPQRIAYYERPWLKKTRQLYAGQYSELFKTSFKHQLANVWPREDLPRIEYYGHHLSHAAAGFQTSPFDHATVVVIDAIGEWDTITIWHACYNKHGQAKYQKLWKRKYPHSIGLMYSAFTQQAGLRPLDEEYILMGMAGWGKTDPIAEIRLRKSLLDNEHDIIFKHNLHLGLPEDIIYPSDNMNMAATVQELTEDLISSVMLQAQNVGYSSNLVYMGGVALNCSANRILGEYFDDIWIMPNPGDAGSSLGAAALAWSRRLAWRDAYLGHDIPGSYPVKDILSELATNKICGVASGRAEFGPRALGNRSLLADPRGADIKDRVNEIKRRQKFRPFAPVILEELVHDYFDMPVNWHSSPYMQTVAQCKRPDLYPAIVHVDGTSRVQTVANDGSGIRELLEAWFEWTGCPMLLNTSLNIRGEPMVNDRADADRFEKLYGVRVLS